MWAHINSPSNSCFPSGDGVQSSKFPDRLKSTASPTEERRLWCAESPPLSFRFRSLCRCDGVPLGSAGVVPALASSATTTPGPPTEDRRDTSSRYYAIDTYYISLQIVINACNREYVNILCVSNIFFRFFIVFTMYL